VFKECFKTLVSS